MAASQGLCCNLSQKPRQWLHCDLASGDGRLPEVRGAERWNNDLLCPSPFILALIFVTAKKLITLEERRQHQSESETTAQL
jgi:hypothetical protein